MTTEGSPTLSVLVLNYNYVEYLCECLDSILRQSYEDFEVIVLDDASTDESAPVLERYAGDCRVRVVRHEANRGYSASLIEGTEVYSTGKYLTVISADDFVDDPDAFSRQIAALERTAGAVACICAYTKVGPSDQRSVRHPLRGDSVIEGADLILRQLQDREFAILHSGTIIEATAYRSAGGYRRDLKNYIDLAMWLSLGYTGRFVYLDRPLYGYRIHARQLSGSRANRLAVLGEGLGLLEQETARARSEGIDIDVRETLRTRIADLALADAFASRRRMAVLRCLDAVRLKPVAALTSSGWWLALIRGALGRRAWGVLAGVRKSSHYVARGARRARATKARSQRLG